MVRSVPINKNLVTQFTFGLLVSCWTLRIQRADMDGDNTHEDICMQTDESKEDWRDNRSLASCAEHLSETKLMSDVNFTFKKYGGRKLQAHRLILSMRSAIFEAMFFGPMKDNRDKIDIEDVEPDIFDLVLRFIYTDKTELNGDTVLKCLYVARKYCLSGLVKLCSDFLENSISAENVCAIYEQAKFFDVEELKQKCYTFIVEKSTDVFKSDDIVNLSYDSLLAVLADESLQSEEILHFKMALHWAVRKCGSENIDPSSENKRNVLRDILNEIRFPVMPPETFAKEVVPEKVLPAEEQVQILQFMVTRAAETPGNVGKYISLPRRGTSLIVDLGDVGSFKTVTDSSYVMKMSSNYDITLLSIGGMSGNFQNIKLICEEDRSLNVNFTSKDFENMNRELRVKQNIKKEIRLLSNKHYKFTFGNSTSGTALYHDELYKSRFLNHVATFGKISISITKIPNGLSNLSFCRM